MTELASFELVRDGDEHATAVLSGEIDASNADELLRSLQAALVAPALTVDLTRLEYLDSAGVRMLYALAEVGSIRGTSVTVAVPPESPVRRVLSYAGVDGVLDVVEPP